MAGHKTETETASNKSVTTTSIFSEETKQKPYFYYENWFHFRNHLIHLLNAQWQIVALNLCWKKYVGCLVCSSFLFSPIEWSFFVPFAPLPQFTKLKYLLCQWMNLFIESFLWSIFKINPHLHIYTETHTNAQVNSLSEREWKNYQSLFLSKIRGKRLKKYQEKSTLHLFESNTTQNAPRNREICVYFVFFDIKKKRFGLMRCQFALYVLNASKHPSTLHTHTHHTPHTNQTNSSQIKHYLLIVLLFMLNNTL